jgi:hypothetical protein
LIVGVTGHQDLGDGRVVKWVRTALAEQIARRRVRRGLSSLAAGTDQIFVEELRSAHIEFEAVIPCDGYEATFSDNATRAKFKGLLACAARIHRLPFPMPTEEAFFAAGKWIVSQCDVLFAVWNGLPAHGLGGTADVVAVAQANRRSWIHIDPLKRSVSDHVVGS